MIFHISYTIPPLRKNFKDEFNADSREQAIKKIVSLKPNAKIQKVEEKLVENKITFYTIQVGEKDFVLNYDLSYPEEKRVIETTKYKKKAFQLINKRVGLYVAKELKGKLVEV